MKRAPGRPKKGESPIDPEEYDNIVKLYYTGYSFEAIAEKYGVHRTTIRTLWDLKLRPRQTAHIAELTMERFYRELEAIKCEAWQRFHSNEPAETREQINEKLEGDKRVIDKVVGRTFRPGLVAWLDVILKATDMEIKMAGLYEIKVKGEIDFRFAGATAEELAAQTVSEIQESLKLIEAA